MYLHHSPNTLNYMLFCLIVGGVILKDKVEMNKLSAAPPDKRRQLHQGPPGLAELQLSGKRSPSLWCSLP